MTTLAHETGEPGPWNPGLQSTLPRRFLPLSTMFRPECVATPLETAEALSDFCGLTPFELVAFLPTRLVLHELLIRVTCDLTVADGQRYEDLGINVRAMTAAILDRHIAPHMADIASAFVTMTAAAHAEIAALIAARQQGSLPAVSPPPPPTGWRSWLRPRRAPPPAAPQLSAEQRDLATLAAWRRQAETAPTPRDRAIYKALARMAAALIRRRGRIVGDAGLLADIALTLYTNDYGSDFIGAQIDPLFREAVAREGFRLLPVQQRAIVMNVKGASAAGKSTMRPQQRALAGRLGVAWEDFALISPDVWRKYLLDYDTLGEATLYAGTLTGHELEIIDRKLDRYMAGKAERGRMTHLLIDRFRFDSFAADGAVEDGSQLLTRFGHLVYMFFMITPPDATVERAWKRGLQFGRYKAVDDLLAHNVEAFTGMPRLFFTWAQRTDKVVHYEFLDNAVAEGALPRTVAYGVNDHMIILDPKYLIDVDRFRKIDIEARSPGTVYPSVAAMAPERNTGFLRECVQHIAHVTFAEHQTGRVYARITHGRVIAWSTLAHELASRDPDIAAALAALGGIPDRGPDDSEATTQVLVPADTDTLGDWGGRSDTPAPAAAKGAA